MKIRLLCLYGTSFIADIPTERINLHGVIEAGSKCFAFRGVNGGVAEYLETGRLDVELSTFARERPPQFAVGRPVRFIKAHREEDEKYVGQLATIIDGAGFITDWRIQFGNKHHIGALTEELEPYD